MQRVQEDSRDNQPMGLDIEEVFVECNDGRAHFLPPEKQSAKRCEDCFHFERDLAQDHPCGLCYESEDKYEWTTTGDVRCGEMELPSERVCETPTGESRH